MSDKKDFQYQILEGVDFKECLRSENPFEAAVNQLRGQNNAVGIMLDKAAQLTGSQQETVQMAISHYEQMIATVTEGIRSVYDDPDFLRQAEERIKAGDTQPKKREK